MPDNFDKLIQEARDKGFETEKLYGGCGQSVLIGIFDVLGIENNAVIKAGTGLAGGLGRKCDGVCGGYAGGCMAISSIFGRRRSYMDGDVEDKMAALEMTAKLREVFIQKYGSIICGDIHQKIFGRNYNLWNDSEMDQFNADGAHDDKCTGVVGEAAAATVGIILDEAKKRNMSLEDIRNKVLD